MAPAWRCAATSARSTRSIKALILTSYDDDEALFSAIMAGAAGYILKQVRGNDLVDTVRRVAAGESMLDPSVTARVLDRVRNGPPRDRQLEALTAQEQKILDLIGEGLTNRQVAERMFLAEKTVKNYVSLAARQARPDQPHPGCDLRHQAPARPDADPSAAGSLLSEPAAGHPVDRDGELAALAPGRPHIGSGSRPRRRTRSAARPTITTLQPIRLSAS